MPGIEPGPPGWKPGILATRPHGIVDTYPRIFAIHAQNRVQGHENILDVYVN